AGFSPRSTSTTATGWRFRRSSNCRRDRDTLLPGGEMICYPSDTDWGCAYTEEQLAEMRGDPDTLKKMELSEARAWYTLAALTAYRIGVCPELVRPTAACCLPFGTW